MVSGDREVFRRHPAQQHWKTRQARSPFLVSTTTRSPSGEKARRATPRGIGDFQAAAETFFGSMGVIAPDPSQRRRALGLEPRRPRVHHGGMIARAILIFSIAAGPLSSGEAPLVLDAAHPGTVILAAGAGKKAARAMHKYMMEKVRT